MNGVAIIGMSCRWPGADSVSQFWRNLCHGVESVTFFSDADLRAAGVPESLLASSRYVKASPVLSDIQGFDASFFECSPREATLIDPQQRLLLEVAWEAFEDAGYFPNGDNGTVGVFAGGGSVVTSYLVANHGHPALAGQTGSLPHISNDKDFFATRVSYKLNLTGPSITVQTACSTSLVALHLACQSVASGESDMALAGASSIRMPDRTGYLAQKGNIYSLDGHCRAFDGEAKGTIFGSGVAAFLLKSVKRAIDDGDHIYAVIKGTAINNDGAQKVSFAAPSAFGQARAFVDAFAVAGVSPESIQYVECHATGTVVGDPIEIQALTTAFRRYTDRSGYCAVGSVKANIGHPEQAAGFAGLMKAALALRHGQIPASINYRTPNPSIDFARSPFYVNTELRDWPQGDTPRRAAINSLGIGGTNAVAIVEEAPASVAQAQSDDWPLHVFTLSAKSDGALKDYARRFHDHIVAEPKIQLPDLCYTTNVSRCNLTHRLAIATNSRNELISKLDAIAAADTSCDIGVASRKERRKIAFLFTGQGAQYFGMGRLLYGGSPTFRRVVDECVAQLGSSLDLPILDVIFADDRSGAQLSQTQYTQPGLFIIEYALTELWRDFGIVPDAVLGHSIGEFAAACVAGVFDVREALQLVVARGRLMQQLPSTGSMAVLFAPEAEVGNLIMRGDATVDIAAVNGPATTVVSGERCALERLLREATAAGYQSRRLSVSNAFHSRLMDPMLSDLRTHAERIQSRAAQIPLVSNVSGRLLTEAPDSEYWCRHARGTVRFTDGMHALRGLGCEVFVEIGPGTGLLSAGRSCLGEFDGRWLPSLTKAGQDWAAMLGSVRDLYVEGAPIRWSAVHAGRTRRRLSLPTYPFQRKRYWVNQAPQDESKSNALAVTPQASATRAMVAEPVHPLLGLPSKTLNEEVHFDTRCSLADTPYLRDHRVHGVPLLPTATALEAAIAAGRSYFGGAEVALESVTYQEALALPEHSDHPVHLVIAPQGSNGAAFRLASQDAMNPGRWHTHVSGVVRRAASITKQAPTDEVRIRCSNALLPEQYYRDVRTLGLDYGPAFRGVQEIRLGDKELVARIALPSVVASEGYQVHPALLDACLHVYPALTSRDAGGEVYLPVGIERFYLNGGSGTDAIAHAVLRDINRDHGIAKVDIDVFDANSELLASFTGLTVKQLPARAIEEQTLPERAEWMYRLEWKELPAVVGQRVAIESGTHWIVFADDGLVGQELARRIRQGGARCTLVLPTTEGKHKSTTAKGLRIDVLDPERIDQALRSLENEQLGRIDGVVYLSALDAPDSERMTLDGLASFETRALGGALHVAQALGRLRQSTGVSPRLWLVTRGTQSVRSGDRMSPGAAGLWGFGRTFALEHPAMWGGLLDLPTRKSPSPQEDTRQIYATLGRGDGEDQVAIRGAKAYGARLVHMPSCVRDDPIAIRSDATYLVTGGLGTIGLEIAQWLVENGARSVLLTGRSSPKERAAAVVGRLEARGASIRIARADISVEEDVRKLFRGLRSGPPLRGVIHCAGVLSDGILAQMSWSKFETALIPKTRGALLLHRYTKDLPLDFFLLQSSILSKIGSAGQCNYTAGNAFLDALAAHRRALGLPATVINWGAWAEYGMAASSGERGEAIWRARGMRYIPLAQGTAAFGDILERGLHDVGVTITDWRTFVEEFESIPALYRELVEERQSPTVSKATPIRRDTIETGKPDDLGHGREWLTTFLTKELCNTLGIDDSINPTQPLNELGLDSLMSVNLANKLERALGATVPVGTLIRGVSIEQIAADLLPRVKIPARVEPAADPIRIAEVRDRAPDPIHTTELREPAREPSPRLREDTAQAPQEIPRARSSPDHWLVFPRPNPEARVRLFCFPFAGGGAAPYRSWVESLDGSIELVAIEPPGHGSRLKERPLKTLGPYLNAVMRAMAPVLDKPFALFGTCLGGLVAYEAGRRLLMTAEGQIVHLFLAGTRPPHKIDEFTPFEHALAKYTLELPEYELGKPAYEQSDAVVSEYIRRFNMEAANEMLRQRELRKLIMPAIRADFSITSRYAPTPIAAWKLPITCFQGHDDPYVSRDHAIEWSRYTSESFVSDQ